MVSLGSYWNDGRKWYFAVTEDGVSTTNAYEGELGVVQALAEAGYTESEAKKLLNGIVEHRFDDADIQDAPADYRILEDDGGLENYLAVGPGGVVIGTIQHDPASALDDIFRHLGEHAP